MTAAISVANLTKRYGDVLALDQVSFDVAENTVSGLLGRNGAGKTTVMQILTGQNWQTSGDVAIFGRPPFENEAVLRDVCFVKESQRYPDVSVRVVLRAAARCTRSGTGRWPTSCSRSSRCRCGAT
jgi:ABC-2 type transport system ATP-binding protein